ncbi:MAG: hypothetical protein KGJ92_08150 [Actinomycetales bacterium]|nr:hypothetical protein [Actinomycetales bacterium]
MSTNRTTIDVASLGGQHLSALSLHAGGVDVITVGLATSDAASALAPSSLSFALPAGSTLHALDVINEATGRPVSGWRCTLSAHVRTCRLSASSGVANAISDGVGLAAYAEIVNAAESRATASTLGVTASLDGAATATTMVPVTMVPTNVPAISLRRAVTPVVSPHATASVEYAVTSGNVASPAGSITIADPIPGALVSSWRSASPSWSCHAAPTSSPTCTYRAVTPAGASTAPLVVTYRIATGHVSARTRWYATLEVTGPYGIRMSRAVPSEVQVASAAPSQLKVSVRTMGSQVVARGSRLTVAVIHQAADGVASGLTDQLIIPKGLTLVSAAGAGWHCPRGVNRVTCTHPSPVLTNQPFGFYATLAASSSAPVGMGIVAAVASARDGSARNASLAIVNVAASRAPSSPTSPATDSSPSVPAAATPTPSASVASPTDTSGPARPSLSTTNPKADAPTATRSAAPARQPHADAAGTMSAAPDTTLQSHACTVTSLPSSLGGFSLSNASQDATTCDWSVTVTASALAFATTLSYSDANDWSFSVSPSTTVSILGQSPTISGTVSDTSGTLSGSVTLALSNASVGGGVSLGGSLSATATSSGSATFSGTIQMSLDSSLSLSADLSYSDASNWSATLSNATLGFGGGVTIAVSGSIANASGVVSGTLTAATTSPVTISSGVTLAGTLAFTYSSATSTPSFSGSVTLTAASMTLPVTFTYSDPQDWAATLAVATSNGTLTVASGFSVPISSLSGSVSEAAGILTWNVTASVSPIDLIPGVLSLGSMTLALGSNCPSTGAYVCPSNADGVYVSFTGSATLNVSPIISNATLSVTAVYGAAGNQFDLAASLSGSIAVVPNVISIDYPTLQISYNDPAFTSSGPYVTLSPGDGTTGGFGFSISGAVTLSFVGQSLTMPVELTYVKGGFAVIASLSETSFALGGTGASINVIAYTTVAATLTMDGTSTTVPADTFVLAGSLSLPTWLTTYLNGVGITIGSLSVVAQYTSASDFSITATLPMSIPIPVTSSDFIFTMGDLAFSAGVRSGNAFLSVSESGTLEIAAAAADGTPQNVVITLALTGTTTEIDFSITGSGVGTNPAWSNAFGYPGLDLNYLSIQAGISLTTLLPSFGLSASGVLPASIMSDLGIGANANVPMSFTVNISASTPCLAVSIGTQGGPTVVDIGSGVLTASYATFVAAGPQGCTVGPTTIPGGFSIGFEGTFVGVAVSFNATLTVSPFAFTGEASVSGFSVGGFTLQGAYVKVVIDTAPASFSLTFNGGIQLGSAANQVEVSGSISSNGNFNLSGTANVNLAGFSLAVTIHAIKTQIPFLGTYVTFADVYGSATVNLLGSTLSLSAAFSASPSGFTTQMSGSLNFAPDGFNLGTVNFNLSITPSAQSFTANATVNLGGVITGALSGTLRQTGGTIGFNFSVAANLNLGSSLSASGNLYIGNCTGTCTSTGPVSASLSGSLTWDGKTYSFSSVPVSASWSFTWTSSGSVNTQSGVLDTGLIAYRASFSGNYYLYISSTSPYLSVNAGFHATIQTAYGHIETRCSGTWYKPWTWHCNSWVAWGGWNNTVDVGASLNTNGQLSATYGGHTYEVNF